MGVRIVRTQKGRGRRSSRGGAEAARSICVRSSSAEGAYELGTGRLISNSVWQEAGSISSESFKDSLMRVWAGRIGVSRRC